MQNYSTYFLSMLRWDVKAIDQFPDYMRVGYFGFFNSINEMAFDAVKEKGVTIVEFL